MGLWQEESSPQPRSDQPNMSQSCCPPVTHNLQHTQQHNTPSTIQQAQNTHITTQYIYIHTVYQHTYNTPQYYIPSQHHPHTYNTPTLHSTPTHTDTDRAVLFSIPPSAFFSRTDPNREALLTPICEVGLEWKVKAGDRTVHRHWS